MAQVRLLLNSSFVHDLYPLPRPPNPIILTHQCPKPAVLGPLLAPHALANFLTGQPLKTTFGLCCCPAGYQYGTVFCFMFCPVELQGHFNIRTVSLLIARNIYYVSCLMAVTLDPDLIGSETFSSIIPVPGSSGS